MWLFLFQLPLQINWPIDEKTIDQSYNADY